MDKLLILAQKAYILFYEKKWIFEDNQQHIPIRKSVRLNTDVSTKKGEDTTTKKASMNTASGKKVINAKVDPVKKSNVKSDEKQMKEDLANFSSKNK